MTPPACVAAGQRGSADAFVRLGADSIRSTSFDADLESQFAVKSHFKRRKYRVPLLAAFGFAGASDFGDVWEWRSVEPTAKVAKMVPM